MWEMSEQDARSRVRLLVQQATIDANVSYPLQYTGIHDPIAKHLQVNLTHAPLHSEFGVYIPDGPDGPSIILDTEKQGKERLNFTYFHEITHHLIRNDDVIYSWINESTDITRIVERLCDVGAAEFILPKAHLQEIIVTEGFSIHLIQYLDERYPASKPMIVAQLIECATHKCHAVICAYGSSPLSKMISLYIEYSFSSSLSKYSIGRYSAIRQSHVINDVFVSKSSYYGKENMPFRNSTSWKVDCDAMYYKDKVYALFHEEQPASHSPNQLMLF